MMNYLIKLDKNAVLDDIQQELEDLISSGKVVPEAIFLKAASIFTMAVSTGNCHYADMGIILCKQNEFTPTDTMNAVISASALTRCMDGSRGTKLQIDREARNTAVKVWVAHLIAAGCTLSEASLKAATLFKDTYPNASPKKASSISKLYEKEFRDIVTYGYVTQQESINKMHMRDEKLNLKWKLIARNTRIEEDLRGNRRD
ncbi:MAG: hypothetical protein MK088_06575 [Alteromonas sp.]|nr:hypothetical protein [Alteromonas sp.]